MCPSLPPNEFEIEESGCYIRSNLTSPSRFDQLTRVANPEIKEYLRKEDEVNAHRLLLFCRKRNFFGADSRFGTYMYPLAYMEPPEASAQIYGK